MGVSLGQFAACMTRPGKRVFIPANGRKPVVVDEWHVIARRKKLAKMLREILYGGLPPRVPGRRVDTWAWSVREFVRLRDFRYSDLLAEARWFVQNHGSPDVTECTTKNDLMELDLELLQAFEKYLRARRVDLETWRRSTRALSEQEKLEGIAAAEAKSLALLGVCAVCGNDLPCSGCGMPAVLIDGKGGIVSV